MATKLQLRRGTKDEWTSTNPVLSSGEMGVETDTKKTKVGDGSSNWNSLIYINTKDIEFTGSIKVPTAILPTEAVNLLQAEELVGGLNGTNYLMVYGTGTPTDNAAELRAAYEEAKKMSRYLGDLSNVITEDTYYYGQTFYHSTLLKYYKIKVDSITTVISSNLTLTVNSIEITKDEAESTKTTIIVAPGDYRDGSPMNFDGSGINVISLTGESDVLVDGVNLYKGECHIKGLKMQSTTNPTYNANAFLLSNDLKNVVIEKCISLGTTGTFNGGAGGSASDINIYATFIDCYSNAGYSFGTYCNTNLFYGKCIRCTGGENAFDGNVASTSVFTDCVGGNSSFGSIKSANGNYTRCSAGSSSFGSISGYGFFIDCEGRDKSFGGGVNGRAYATYYRCKCSNGSSFGGDSTGLADYGRFYYCEGWNTKMSTSTTCLFCISNNKMVNTITES